MDFFAFLWLTSLTVLLPLAGMRYSMEMKRRKMEMEAASADEGMTLGELRRLIREEIRAELDAQRDDQPDRSNAAERWPDEWEDEADDRYAATSVRRRVSQR